MSIFSFSKVNRTKYSTFNMSHDVKLSCEMGQLVPFMCQEILPGDKFKVTSETLVRMAPMLAPLMHRVDVRVEYFFVPCRILTPAWEKVMFPKPNKEIDVQLPFVQCHGAGHLASDFGIYSWSKSFDGVQSSRNVSIFGASSLADYLGVPLNVDDQGLSLNINLLPFLAYQRIYNDYYRDENLHPDLQDMQAEDFRYFDPGDPDTYAFVGGGNNLFDLVGNLEQIPSGGTGDMQANTIYELFRLRNRCWEKDYFTSALPWRQAGAPAVAPLQFDNTGNTLVRNQDGSILKGESRGVLYGGGPNTLNGQITSSDYNNHLQIDNSTNLGLSIADLQTASWLQRFLENIALGGHRMVEQILTHFGVRVPDYRLDRAEYLGGNRTPLVVSQVLQTSNSVDDSPLANPAGNAKSIGVNKALSRTFEEHGFLMGIVSIMPRTTYSQGLQRMFTRFDRLDFAWPEFAMLGEQEVKNQELFIGRDMAYNQGTFGYQQRYAEYKYIQSSVHGDFASTLDFWHMGREFGSEPNLNRAFVTADPTTRIWSVPSATNHVWMMIHNNVLANRPLPQVSNSSLA